MPLNLRCLAFGGRRPLPFDQPERPRRATRRGLFFHPLLRRTASCPAEKRTFARLRRARCSSTLAGLLSRKSSPGGQIPPYPHISGSRFARSGRPRNSLRSFLACDPQFTGSAASKLASLVSRQRLASRHRPTPRNSLRSFLANGGTASVPSAHQRRRTPGVEPRTRRSESLQLARLRTINATQAGRPPYIAAPRDRRPPCAFGSKWRAERRLGRAPSPAIAFQESVDRVQPE